MSCFHLSSIDRNPNVPRVASRKGAMSPKSTIGIVSAVALSIVFAGGVVLIIVTVFYVPKTLFMPLMITGSGISGGSFILIAGILLASAIIACKSTPKPKPSEIPSTQKEKTPESRSPIIAEHSPILKKKTTSGLPKNFIRPGLNNTCWANATLQALCLLDDELKAKMDEIPSSHPDFPLVNIVRTIVRKLDDSLEVSIEEMLELMKAVREHLNQSRAGTGMLDYNLFLDNFIHIIMDGKALIKDIPASGDWNVMWIITSKPGMTLNDYFNKKGTEEIPDAPTPELPETLMLNFNLGLGCQPTHFSSDDKKQGLYYITFPIGEGKFILYKYQLKGTIESLGNHFIFRRDTGNKTHLIYNDDKVSENNNPLTLTSNTKTGIFHRLGDPEIVN